MLFLRKLAADGPAVTGGAIVLLLVVVAILAPVLAPYPHDVAASHLLRRLAPPSSEHPFGTDNLGRDILSRVILGTRGALTVALSVVLAVPQLILALAFAQLIGPSLKSAMLALTLTYWPFFTRIVYAEAKRLKASLFVDALECIGARGARILFLHILPNCISPIIVRTTIGMGFTILVAAVLGFLGMGATPPDPDWGLAIAESRQYLPDAWWYSTFPGLAIFFTVLGFNLLGDGLSDVVDPRLRRSR
jgi:peptide/nickel transport system permease protein